MQLQEHLIQKLYREKIPLTRSYVYVKIINVSKNIKKCT